MPLPYTGALLASYNIQNFTFEASEEDENKCSRCDKLKEHHHNEKRDGTISEYEWCYDFLLDF